MSVISGESFKRGRFLEQSLKQTQKIKKMQLKHNVDIDVTLEVESELWAMGVKYSADRNFGNEKSLAEFDSRMAQALLKLTEMSVELTKLVEINLPR